MSSEERNKALVRRFLEAHSRGDLDVLGEMLAPDFVDNNLLPDQEPVRKTREGYLQATAEYNGAFSESRYIIEKQVAEGDARAATVSPSATSLKPDTCDLPTESIHRTCWYDDLYCAGKAKRFRYK